jgi:transposase
MSSIRRTYAREFKIEAAKLSYNSDKPVEEIAESLGVSQSSLNRWRREYREDPDQAFPGQGQQKERDAEVARLKKELKQAQLENEILKKAAAIPSASLV